MDSSNRGLPERTRAQRRIERDSVPRLAIKSTSEGRWNRILDSMESRHEWTTADVARDAGVSIASMRHAIAKLRGLGVLVEVDRVSGIVIFALEERPALYLHSLGGR